MSRFHQVKKELNSRSNNNGQAYRYLKYIGKGDLVHVIDVTSYIHVVIENNCLNAARTLLMNEKTSRVLLRVSTRMAIDGRLGDEVMTSVTVKKGRWKLTMVTHLYKVLMRRQERGCIPAPDLPDSDDRSGQGSGPSLYLRMYIPDTFHKWQPQALPVPQMCSVSRVPGLSLQRMLTTNANGLRHDTHPSASSRQWHDAVQFLRLFQSIYRAVKLAVAYSRHRRVRHPFFPLSPAPTLVRVEHPRGQLIGKPT